MNKHAFTGEGSLGEAWSNVFPETLNLIMSKLEIRGIFLGKAVLIRTGQWSFVTGALVSGHRSISKWSVDGIATYRGFN